MFSIPLTEYRSSPQPASANRLARSLKPLGLIVVVSYLVCSSAAAAERPNVLLVMTDDQGWGDIRSHGNPQIHTPHLDSLAASGARADRFYVSPVCAPTRAALLTGRWHPRTGVHGVTRNEETMRAEETTFAELFRDAGYATGCFGKWHNGAHYPHDPNGQGFGEFLGFCAGHWDLYFDSPLQHNQEPTRGDGFIIDHLTDAAIDFIKRHESAKPPADKPWLCYVPYNTPHTPWQVPEKFWRRYTDSGLPVETACAHAMVENIDHNVGRLLETIDSLGQTENTVVVFLTDNGANTDRYDGHMQGRKGSLHEGGSRVPLFVRYPAKVPAGIAVQPLIAHIDLLPTLCTWAEITIPDHLEMDGRPLNRLLESGSDPSLADRVLFNHWKGSGAVRTPRWRAVKSRRGKQAWQLFDMVSDPGEMVDVSKMYPQELSALQSRYDAWWEDVTANGFDPVAAEIGHPQAPIVRLHGHEAILKPEIGSGIAYHGRQGWANDWIDQWTDASARATWPVDVTRAGRYAITILYTAPEDAVGTKLRLAANDAASEAMIEQAFTAAPIPTNDRIIRKEVSPQTWNEFELPAIALEAGPQSLRLERAADGAAIQVKQVRLERIP